MQNNNRLIGIVVFVGFLLLIPYVAMKFTAEVNWDWADFVFAAVMLLGTGLLCELVLRKVTSTFSRLALCAGILVGLAIIWVEVAVGIFGSPIAGS